MTFIGDTIYQLKREYGGSLTIGISTVIGQSPTTGKINLQTNEIKIKNAIRLPNQIAFDFLRSLGAIKGGDIPVGTFQILIDRKDVPTSFPVVQIDYANYKGKRLDIIKVEDDLEEAIILFVKMIVGAKAVGIKKQLSDSLTPSELLTNG